MKNSKIRSLNSKSNYDRMDADEFSKLVKSKRNLRTTEPDYIIADIYDYEIYECKFRIRSISCKKFIEYYEMIIKEYNAIEITSITIEDINYLIRSKIKYPELTIFKFKNLMSVDGEDTKLIEDYSDYDSGIISLFFNSEAVKMIKYPILCLPSSFDNKLLRNITYKNLLFSSKKILDLDFEEHLYYPSNISSLQQGFSNSEDENNNILAIALELFDKINIDPSISTLFLPTGIEISSSAFLQIAESRLLSNIKYINADNTQVDSGIPYIAARFSKLKRFSMNMKFKITQKHKNLDSIFRNFLKDSVFYYMNKDYTSPLEYNKKRSFTNPDVVIGLSELEGPILAHDSSLPGFEVILALLGHESPLESLEDLSLRNTRINDECCNLLANSGKARSLKRLDLSINRITDFGKDILLKATRKGGTLENLEELDI